MTEVVPSTELKGAINVTLSAPVLLGVYPEQKYVVNGTACEKVIAVPEPIIDIPTPEIVGNDIVPVLSETRIDTPAPGNAVGKVKV